MMLFRPEFKMEEFKTAIEKRAFMGGLYYAMQHIQAYSAELFFDDSAYSEVPADRLKSMANDLMTVMQKVLAEAQALEKAEHEKHMAMMAPPPVTVPPEWQPEIRLATDLPPSKPTELSNEPD